MIFLNTLCILGMSALMGFLGHVHFVEPGYLNAAGLGLNAGGLIILVLNQAALLRVIP